MDGPDRDRRLSGVQLRPAKGPGAHHQGHDAGPAGADRPAGRPQLHPGGGDGGREVLPAARLCPCRRGGLRPGDHGRDEPGVFHPERRHCVHGGFGQLHGQGLHPHRGGGAHLLSGYVRGPDGGTYHLPRLLLLRREAGQRPAPDFPDAAESLCQRGRRPSVGDAVLSLYDLRQLLHGHCRL